MKDEDKEAVKELLCDYFEQIRDFFYELASQDNYIYPYLNMDYFANYCLKEGVGLFKAEVRPEKEPSDNGSQKMMSKSKSS